MKQSRRKPTTNAFGISEKRQTLEEHSFKIPRPGERSYARHFDGYSETYAESEDGKSNKFVRIYTGTLYRQDITNEHLRRIKARYLISYILAAAAVIVSAFLNTVSNLSWYVLLAFLVTGIFYVRVLFALLAYLPAGIDLKIHEYRDGITKIPDTSTYAALSTAVPFIATIVSLFLVPDSFSGMEIFKLCLLVLSAILIFLHGRTGISITFTRIDPDTQEGQANPD